MPEEGRNSVLFDGSHLTVEENRWQIVEVVAEARDYGAAVEGEIEGIRGVEDGVGSDAESEVQSLEAHVGRSYVGEYCTSLEMAGASLTLVRLDEELAELLAAPAEAAVRIF
jgi:fructose/tagatose bisphosphate aldolase